MVTDNGESVTADTVHRGLNNGERNGGRDCGIDRVSTVLQYLNAGLGCKRLGGSNNIAGIHAGAARDMPVIWVKLSEHDAKLNV